VLAFLFVEDFDGSSVALLDVGLNDLRDRLALGDMIADGDADRCQSAGGGGSRFDHATAAADQNPFAGGAGGDTPDDPPCQRGDKRTANDEYDDPVERPGNADQVVELFGRRRSLQRYGAKCPLRQIGHLRGSIAEPGTFSPEREQPLILSISHSSVPLDCK